MLGKTFRSALADGNPLWKVVQKRGANVWVCEVVDEQIEMDGKKFSSDFAGHRQVFAGEQIEAAIQAEKWMNTLFARSDAFYAALKPGQIVHYSNGRSSWVRCRAERRNKKMVIIPIALVGKWEKYDLPYRQRTGEEVYPYHPERIRKGEPFETPASNIYECAEHNRGKVNPASLPVHDLTIPPITETEAVSIALWQKLKKVEDVLRQHEQNPNKLLDQIRDIVS